MAELSERTAPGYVAELRREASRWRHRVRTLEEYIKSTGIDPATVTSGQDQVQRRQISAHPPQ